ncbi:MAG: bifunctional hydroxymethylpyrimidine kinase/phosphomethylpyrimidine kinase [Bdellovibrionales bacterium]|nr:bifunctional hydroxymethylpyrimidine kinase/phosphomethylpyrimidine kinase [Bdellovibrionales bacterium]
MPVVAVARQHDKLGLAANVAENIRAFGAQPFLASMIGEDRHAEEFLGLLKAAGIPAQNVFRHPGRRTTLKERVVAQNQQVVRIDHEITAPLPSDLEDFFLDRVKPVLGDFDSLILEDYGKGLLTDRVLREVIASARAAGKPVLVDPTTAVRSPEVYRGVTLFKPNQMEAEKLTGVEILAEADLHRAGEKLMTLLGADNVIITQGKEGMTLFGKSVRPKKIPAFTRAVYDVSGAGDTVISLLSLALAADATMEEAALLANFAAGVEVGKPGTATVSLAELETYMVQLGGLLG